MEPTVVFGGLLSIVGLYALLTREHSAKEAGEAAKESKAFLDQLTSRTGAGYALTLTGLLILIAVASRPTAWWGESILDGPLPTGIYWLGTLAALAGTVTVAVAASDRTAFAGIALTGTGGALLFGLAGDLVAGVALIFAAAAGGWATQALTSESDDAAPASFPEPLLLAVSIVALFALTASTLHRSATTESPLAETFETGSRSLPRPTVARKQVTDAVTSQTQPDLNTTEQAGSPWHSVATYGLLIVVAAAGVWQQFSNRSSHTATISSIDGVHANSLFADNTTKSPTETQPPATGDHI